MVEVPHAELLVLGERLREVLLGAAAREHLGQDVLHYHTLRPRGAAHRVETLPYAGHPA